MKKIAVLVSLIALSSMAYQVTGPVLEVTDTKIVVQKGKEKWELAKSPTTKNAAEVNVGDKVTVEYTMTASTIEVKADKKKK